MNENKTAETTSGTCPHCGQPVADRSSLPHLIKITIFFMVIYFIFSGDPTIFSLAQAKVSVLLR